MKKVNLHIKDGKVIAENGKEFVLARLEDLERLQEKLKEANEVIKWYDGLENILVGWDMITGQPKGTANNYLEKWGVK